MERKFEADPNYRAAQGAYWNAYWMWERCKADATASYRDLRDCGQECALRESEWAMVMWRVCGSGRNGAPTKQFCREWIRDDIVRVVDARWTRPEGAK